MSATMTRSGPVGATMALPTDRVIEGDLHEEGSVTGSDFGVYRARKNPVMLRGCLDVLNRGGVAALVPAAASDSYFDGIVARVEHFARTRANEGSSGAAGILALPTSGSTGSPKLVALPARGIARFLDWGRECFALDAATVSLSLSPWNFDVSLLDTWAVLAAGGTVIAGDAARIHDAGYLRHLLAERRPTFVQVVPSTLEALVRAVGEDQHESLKHVVLTGGTASRDSRAALARAFPAAVFHHVYGATEVNDCLALTMSADEFAESEVLSLGTPISGCEVVTLSADGVTRSVRDSTTETLGELLVRTPWMALGYIASGTLEPLPTTEEGAHGTLYPMKDRASWAAGRLTYLGRCDRTMKIRGQRINLDEIEQAARATGLTPMGCAWVEESTGTQELHLAYTAVGSGQPAASGLQVRMRLSQTLPAFSMPNHLHPFAGPFPLNGNGKPDLAAIKKQLESE